MKEELLVKLYENRLLASDDEFNTFELALASLAELVDETDIPELCNVLDDNTEDEEVLFGIVHLMEKFSSLEAFVLTVVGLSKIAKKSPRWAKIVLYRCLNDEGSREMLKKALQKADIIYSKEVVSLLNMIQAEEFQRFGSKIQEILG